MEKGISIIIPTYNGGQVFAKCLEMIRQQDYGGQIQLIIVDSGSTDGTTELAEKAGAVVRRIEKREFHHARTRNAALPLAKCDKVIFVVQDAVPCSNIWLSALERSLCETDVAAVYTDQIPHDDANPYARFENQCIRDFRGQEPVLQSLDSVESFRKMPYHDAYRAIALDNVCAIYRKESLMDVPFPEVDFAEDLAWSLANMLKGQRVLYQPGIKVKHSHNRLPEYGFHRQIVNSFWCAKIMHRVARDMSSLTLRDLMSLTSGARLVGVSLRSNLLKRGDASDSNGGKGPQVIDKIVGRYSLKNRVRWLLIDRLSRDRKDGSSELRKIKELTGQDINYVLEWMKTNCNATSEDELMEALEQITANLLGRIYGEVYASCIIGGKVSPKLEAFMRPYMQGV